jgi:hypothetical protein
MKTSEMGIEMKKTLDKLVGLFLDRNSQYAGEEEWAANFNRNAKIIEAMRIDKIITKPYGKSIAMVVDKVDRLVNGIIVQGQGIKATHLGDSIDDGIVYLFITKMLLKENGIIE